MLNKHRDVILRIFGDIAIGKSYCDELIDAISILSCCPDKYTICHKSDLLIEHMNHIKENFIKPVEHYKSMNYERVDDECDKFDENLYDKFDDGFGDNYDGKLLNLDIFNFQLDIMESISKLCAGVITTIIEVSNIDGYGHVIEEHFDTDFVDFMCGVTELIERLNKVGEYYKYRSKWVETIYNVAKNRMNLCEKTRAKFQIKSFDQTTNEKLPTDILDHISKYLV